MRVVSEVTMIWNAHVMTNVSRAITMIAAGGILSFLPRAKKKLD
jgi:hypothetical protein